MTLNPTFSIVVPVYNAAPYIGSCLESILAQSSSGVELIVIDGGSTDGTSEIIASYSDQIAYWISEPDHGQSHAINKGFSVATGDVLAWLNADEEYLPGALRRVAEAFSERDDVDFVYGHRLECSDGTQGPATIEIRYPTMHPYRYVFLCGRVLPTDASFWSRRAHEQTGSLDEQNFQHLCMDYDWLLRLSVNVRRFRHIAQPLSRFNQHHERKTVMAGAQEISRLWALARSRFRRQHPVADWRVVLGWATSAASARLQLRSFRLPHLGTASRMVGSARQSRGD